MSSDLWRSRCCNAELLSHLEGVQHSKKAEALGTLSRSLIQAMEYRHGFRSKDTSVGDFSKFQGQYLRSSDSVLTVPSCDFGQHRKSLSLCFSCFRLGSVKLSTF